MSNVNIGRLRLRLRTPGHGAESLQARSSNWFHAQGQREVGEVLSAAGPAGVLDRLVVGMGDIPLSRFEAVMSERIRARLAQALTAARPFNEKREDDVADTAEGTASPSVAAQAGAAPVADVSARFRQLLRYLDSGVMVDARAWQGPAAREAWLKEALAQASRAVITRSVTGDVPPRVALALCLLQPRAVQRLVTTWSGAVLVPLISWLVAPARLPTPSPAQAVALVPLAALVTVQQHPLNGAVARALWMSGDDTGLPPHPVRRPDGVSEVVGEAPDRAVLDRWLAEVLQAPLPAGLRTPLLTWLSQTPGVMAHLPHLSVSVQARLRANLGDRLPAQALSWDAAEAPDDGAPWATGLGEADITGHLSAAMPDVSEGTREAGRGEGDAAEASATSPTPSAFEGGEAAGHAATTQSEAPDRPGRPEGARVGDEADGDVDAGFAAVEAASSARRPARVQNGGDAAPRPSPSAVAATDRARAPERPLPLRPRPALTPVPEVWGITNAGLVLLWPLLPTLFDTFGWVKDGQFVDEAACWQAVAALGWLVWGENDFAEWRSPCARALCGVALEAPFEAHPVTADDQAALDAWLTDMLRAVPLFVRCGAGMLRTAFLQRTGTLTTVPGLQLTVEPETADVLLHDLPWPLTPVVLPWLHTLINVEWKA